MSKELMQIVQENPQITLKEIQQKHPELNFKPDAFYSTRYRLGLTKKQSSPKQTLRQKVLSLLESSPQGLTTTEIIDKFKITSKSAFYSTINDLKEQGASIKNINGKYFASSSKLMVVNQKPLLDQKIDTDSMQKDLHISQKLLKDISKLSETDKNDFLDMMKKSIFYRLSANALLQATQAVEDLKHSTFL